VGIILRFYMGMVFTVHRDPLLGHYSGG